jgi:N-methylhydantoinase A
VLLPARTLTADDADTLKAGFDATYAQLYGRTIPGMDIEVLTFALSLGVSMPTESARSAEQAPSAAASSTRGLFDVERAQFLDAAIYRREHIGTTAINGPAVVVEDQTSTVVPRGYSAVSGADGALVLQRLAEA